MLMGYKPAASNGDQLSVVRLGVLQVTYKGARDANGEILRRPNLISDDDKFS